jgi:hypothetical protein
MASGHMNRVKRPDTWLHRPMLQNVKKVLANPKPSTHLSRVPALADDADALLTAGQGLLLGGALFALFCLTLEVERLGHAPEGNAPD